MVGKGARPRAVLLPDPLVAVLKVHLTEVRPQLPASDLVFVNPRGYGHHQAHRFEQAALGREVELAGLGAGVPGRHYPHKWRHTYATELVRAGVDIHVVQRLLGHRSIRSTVSATPTSCSTTCATRSPRCGDDPLPAVVGSPGARGVDGVLGLAAPLLSRVQTSRRPAITL